MPVELHADLKRVADEVVDVPMATLIYGWVRDAYWTVIDAAERGVDPGLPWRQVLRGRAAGKISEVSWTQGHVQYGQCRNAIVAAGSNLEAVIIAGARRLVEGGGSLESQRWPRPRTRRLTPGELAQLRAGLPAALGDSPASGIDQGQWGTSRGLRSGI